MYNGDLYFGELSGDKKNGRGILLLHNKSIYLGDWREDEPDKRGAFVKSQMTLCQDLGKNFRFEFLNRNNKSFASYFRSNNQLIGLF